MTDETHPHNANGDDDDVTRVIAAAAAHGYSPDDVLSPLPPELASLAMLYRTLQLTPEEYSTMLISIGVAETLRLHRAWEQRTQEEIDQLHAWYALDTDASHDV